MSMKTSDKIVLYSTVSVFGLLMVVHLLHYEKYRRGEVLDFNALETTDFSQHSMEGIHWVVLDGPMKTLLYPADSLRFDLDKGNARLVYSRDGDTLHVTLDAWARSAHDSWNSYQDYPAVHLFFPALRGIQIRNGFAVLDNEKSRAGVNVALELDSTQLYVGNFDPDRDSVFSVEPWDTISVREINSNVIVNRQAHVKTLDLRLDAKSEISDRYSVIDTGNIQADSTAALHLHGKNLSKIHLDGR